MKIRIFKNVCNSVVRVVVNTEDFSQEEIKLMCQFGEPEINVGGFSYPGTAEKGGLGEESPSGAMPSIELGDEFVRIMHGFPYARGFDMRDNPDVDMAAMIEMANDWVNHVEQQILDKMTDLRDLKNSLPTEEVFNI